MKIACIWNASRLIKYAFGKTISILTILIVINTTGVNGQEKKLLNDHGAGIKTEKRKKKNNVKTFTISGKVTQTFSYCGGASPPKQILDRLATPVAYPGKIFYIRHGKVNTVKAKVICKFTTGKEGEFSINLSPGIYSIIQEGQVQQIKAADLTKNNQQVDEKCLQEWWKKPYFLLEVKNNDIEHLNFNIQHTCHIDTDIPCVTYTGPSPQ